MRQSRNTPKKRRWRWVKSTIDNGSELVLVEFDFCMCLFLFLLVFIFMQVNKCRNRLGVGLSSGHK
jgi:hypothetical protein